MSFDNWIECQNVLPNINQCDDGAFDSAMCQNLNCLRDEVQNIIDTLILGGAGGGVGGDPAFTDTGSGTGENETFVVQDEIPPGVHDVCNSMVEVTPRVCSRSSGPDESSQADFNYNINVFCQPTPGAAMQLLSTTLFSGSVEYNPGQVDCASSTIMFSGLSCTGQLFVSMVWVSGDSGLIDRGGVSFTAETDTFCI